MSLVVIDAMATGMFMYCLSAAQFIAGVLAVQIYVCDVVIGR